MNRIMKEVAAAFTTRCSRKDGLREMLRTCATRRGVVRLHQSYGGKAAALIPFFNEPAMTNHRDQPHRESHGAAVLP